MRFGGLSSALSFCFLAKARRGTASLKMKTDVIKVDINQVDKDVLNKAAGVIKNGGLVAFPTETVYGLGADYLNKNAVRKLYEVKKRPADKPFTILISDLYELIRLTCEVSVLSRHLIERFFPGPLTLIFKMNSGEKIGIRMPRHKFALEFVSACNTPIAATSANISGGKSPRNAEDVLRCLDGKIALLLDGGEADIGIESTVVDVSVSPYEVLREGAISKGQIADAVKMAV